MIAVAAVVIAMIALLAVGMRHHRPAAAKGSISADGFTLASARIDLPADDPPYPDGPHADLVNLHCTACHSTSMVLTQPPLSADQWTAEVKKMREVYRAPIPEYAVPGILAYLNATSARQRTASR